MKININSRKKPKKIHHPSINSPGCQRINLTYLFSIFQDKNRAADQSEIEGTRAPFYVRISDIAREKLARLKQNYPVLAYRVRLARRVSANDIPIGYEKLNFFRVNTLIYGTYMDFRCLPRQSIVQPNCCLLELKPV